MRKLIVALLLAASLPAGAGVLLDDRSSAASLSAVGTCPATGGAVRIDSTGSATVGVDISGTFVGTLGFRGSIDGTALIALAALPPGGAAPVASATTTGTYLVQAAGLKWVCVFVSAYTSGTAVVSLEASPASAGTTQAAGAVPYFNDTVTTATQIKATSGTLSALSLVNTTAAAAYLQVFCKPSASVVLGTTTPDWQVRMLASAAAVVALPAPICGSGTGLTIAGTTTAGGAVGAALSVSAAYQ